MKKNNCIDCNKKTTSGVYILTGKGWIYEFYCLNCARAFLGKLSTQSFIKANLMDLNNLSRQYDMILQNNKDKIMKIGFKLDNVPIEFKKNIMERTS